LTTKTGKSYLLFWRILSLCIIKGVTNTWYFKDTKTQLKDSYKASPLLLPKIIATRCFSSWTGWVDFLVNRSWMIPDKSLFTSKTPSCRGLPFTSLTLVHSTVSLPSFLYCGWRLPNMAVPKPVLVSATCEVSTEFLTHNFKWL
jgi:hypothetical protein